VAGATATATATKTNRQQPSRKAGPDQEWKQLRVDMQVYDKLAEQGNFGDSFNDILRRMLKLPASK
jgi:uncharacterized protein (DUF4415 family)